MARLSLLYRDSKQFTASYIQGLKCLGSKEQKQLLILGMILGVVNVALSLFSLYTLLSVGLLLGAIAGFIAIKIMTITREGVINYIPLKYHNVLLNRSIFDILCDIWFEPRIIIYVKALVLPFLVKLDPAEAVEQFNDFPPHLRETVLTKGLVNIMPGFVRKAIVPPGESTNDSPSEPSSISIEEEELMENREDSGSGIRERRIIKSSNEVLSDTNRSGRTTATIPITPRRIIDLTDDNSADPLAPFRNDRIALNNKDIIARNKLEDNKKALKAQAVEFSKTWDRLEEFIRKNREKIIKQRMGLIPPVRTFELKGPLSKLQKLGGTLNAENLLSKLDGKALTALFLVSGIGLMSQVALSKRTRAWTLNLLYLLAYVAGISVTSGSFALLVLKLKARFSKKPAVTNN